MLSMKNKYLVKMKFNDYKNIKNIKATNIFINENEISFKTDQKSLNILRNRFEYIYFQNILKTKLKNIFLNHFMTIIGIIIFSLFIFILSKTIVKVEFSDENTYDSDVYEKVIKELDSIGPFKFLNKDLKEIDSDLKKLFYHYEWIGIKRKGTVLLIDIVESNLKDNEDEKNIVGSIYSKYDAIVKKYYLSKGIINVTEEQYVNKGDLLISGMIKHYNNEIEMVKADGVVIGEVLKYYDLVINKEEITEIRNGKIYYQDFLFFKDKRIGKEKNKFDSFDYVLEERFSLFGIIKINRIYYYEKEIVNNIYNLDDAITLGKSKIYNQFYNNKISDIENIKYIKLVRNYEDDKKIYLKFVIKSEESIGEFFSN